MSSDKYIGLDVHRSTISIAVLDSAGKLVMECTIETKAALLLFALASACGEILALTVAA
jgi:hypothetical protein